MDFALSEDLQDIRAAVRELCADFPGEYWRGLEPDSYPEEFVRVLTEHGWLAALIPEEYGGWVVDGQKIWTSRARQSDLMVLLARTEERPARRTQGLSVFVVDMRDRGDQLTINPVATMMNHSTTEVFFAGLELPEDALVGEAGEGFRYILTGMNAERMLIASECIGDGRFLVDRAVAYARERVVFGRPIGANQGVQFPLARAHMALEAASLVRWKAVWLYERGEDCGAEANMAKFLASEASFAAANAAVDTHGGFGFAREYDVERKFRETRLYQVAPISNHLVQAYVGQHVLGLPRSY
jgi:acyl-CoA dehydrogenase